MGIQICSYERPPPFQTGYISENTFPTFENLFWSQWANSRSPNLAQSNHGWRDFKYFQINGQTIFQGDNNYFHPICIYFHSFVQVFFYCLDFFQVRDMTHGPFLFDREWFPLVNNNKTVEHSAIYITPVAGGGGFEGFVRTPLWKLVNTIKVDVLFKLTVTIKVLIGVKFDENL